MVTRRTLLSLCCFGGLSYLAATNWHSDKKEYIDWQTLYSSLALDLDIDDFKVSRESLERAIAHISGLFSASTHVDQYGIHNIGLQDALFSLTDGIHQDFEKGRFSSLQGWCLSQVELSILNLVYNLKSNAY